MCVQWFTSNLPMQWCVGNGLPPTCPCSGVCAMVHLQPAHAVVCVQWFTSNLPMQWCVGNGLPPTCPCSGVWAMVYLQPAHAVVCVQWFTSNLPMQWCVCNGLPPTSEIRPDSLRNRDLDSVAMTTKTLQVVVKPWDKT